MSSEGPWETHAGGTNGWGEYKRLVVNELDRTNNRLDMMDKRLGHIDRSITELKTKMYMISGVTAMVFSGILSLLLKFV
tara:strand:- start:308 stop:544 length:237 start_codon:yes stop_codon:yes gene_type:complete